MALLPYDADLIADVAAQHNMTSVEWACIIDDSPLALRLQYTGVDGATRRVEATRPWRTSGWRVQDDAVVTSTCDDPSPSPSPSTRFHIAILSVPRSIDYFTDTMKQVRRHFPERRTHVITDRTPSDVYDPWARVANVTLHVLPVSSRLDLKRRSILMYEYALSVGGSDADVLVLEDDILLHDTARYRLHSAIDEIAQQRHPRASSYVLDCYVVSWQGLKPEAPMRYTFVETDYGCCTQCMYFSRNITARMREAMRVERTRPAPDPYDFVITRTARDIGAPIYGTQGAVVQHRGRVSTGLTGVKGLHTTNRFLRRVA